MGKTKDHKNTEKWKEAKKTEIKRSVRCHGHCAVVLVWHTTQRFHVEISKEHQPDGPAVFHPSLYAARPSVPGKQTKQTEVSPQLHENIFINLSLVVSGTV